MWVRCAYSPVRQHPGMAATYLSGPAIAALRATARMTENQAMRRGRYGPVLWRDRVAYVAKDAIERRIGLPITPEQISAIAGKPNRVLVATPQQRTDDLSEKGDHHNTRGRARVG